MTKIKTYLIYIPIIIGFLGSFCLGLATNNQDNRNYGDLNASFPYGDPNVSISEDGDKTDLGNHTSIKEDEYKVNGDETIIRRLLGVFGLKNDKNNDLKFIDYAKAIINIALGLMTFIALVMSIYTFYLMIFSDDDKSIEKAKKNLVGIFIALCVTGLARSIVSLIFRRYQTYRNGQEDVITNNSNVIVNENK